MLRFSKTGGKMSAKSYSEKLSKAQWKINPGAIEKIWQGFRPSISMPSMMVNISMLMGKTVVSMREKPSSMLYQFVTFSDVSSTTVSYSLPVFSL